MRHHNLQVTGSVVVNGLGVATASELTAYTASTDAKISTLQAFTSSVGTTNTFTASASGRLNSIETITASNIGRLNAIETITSSNVARLNSIETITSSNVARLNSLEAKTGSLATTGSNTFIGTQTITGSLYISSDLIVQGSSSLQNITASAVSIGTNLINLNTANPAIRYAGLVIGDSGSVGGSGSFLYDSVQDEMIFVHRGASTTVTSSVVLMGPQTFDTIGTETYPTSNIIQKGTGNEHLIDSCIFDNGTTTCIKNNLIGTGTACFSNSVCGLGIVAGTSGMRSSGNLVFPANLATYCIWNEGYGGGIQLRRSDATTDRYARIGIVNDTGVWVSGMTIDGSTAFAKFDAGICTSGGACLSKILVNSVTDDAASALQIKVLAANATSARIASTTNNNLFSFISNGIQGHAIMDMGRCTESGTFGPGYIRLRVDGNSWIQGGCVGINTSSPDQSLTINQAATTTGQGIPPTSGTTQNGILRLRPAIGVYGETLDFGMNVTPTYGWIQSTNASNLSTNYELRLNPNGGSVTVGTSCAAFGRKLTVSTDVVAYYSDTENITMGISAGTGAQSWGIQVCDTGDGNSTLHLNARGGYVGINKGAGNTAAYSLDVTGTIKASSNIISDSSLIACAFQGVGFSTLTAGAGTGTAVYDTITRSGNGLYEVALIANANAGGASYNDFYYGRLLIGTGYQFPNVVDYLVWCQESTQPRNLYGSGGGNLTVNVCMYQSSVESSCIGTNGAYTIRFKISGYNSGYTGAGTTIYLKRII